MSIFGNKLKRQANRMIKRQRKQVQQQLNKVIYPAIDNIIATAIKYRMRSISVYVELGFDKNPVTLLERNMTDELNNKSSYLIKVESDYYNVSDILDIMYQHYRRKKFGVKKGLDVEELVHISEINNRPIQSLEIKW